MNFIDFLKNNSVVSFTTSPSKNSSNKLKQPDTTVSKKHNIKEKINLKKEQEKISEPSEHQIIQQQPLKKGDFVKIVKYKNSIYNYYKNYIAEIKEYNQYQNYVIVFLHPTHNFKLLQLHADHVIKI